MPVKCSICVLSFQGHLHDAVDVLDWLMERDNVLPRLSSRVLSPSKLTLEITENIGELVLTITTSEFNPVNR